MKRKIRNLIIIFTLLIYNTISGLFFSVTFSSVNNTINSIAFPNGLFTLNLTTPDPEVRITFGISNSLLSPVENVKLDFSIDIVYYNLTDESSGEIKIFQKQEKLGAVKPLERINRTIISTTQDFNLEFLDAYWNSIENLTGLIFYVDLEVNCGIMGNLILVILLIFLSFNFVFIFDAMGYSNDWGSSKNTMVLNVESLKT